MYEDELAIFASGGVRAVALDLMGQGNSITNNTAITIERHADNVECVLKKLALEDPVIIGGHYSSQLAAELAKRQSIGASLLVIDGGVLIDDLESSKLAGKTARVKPALLPQADKSHRDFLWRNAENIFDIYAPDYEITDETSLSVYRHIKDYLAAYLQAPGASLLLPPLDYPFAETLAQLTVPAVFLTADTETLASSVGPMSDIYGGPFSIHSFGSHHPLHFPSRKGEYARAILSMLD
ncbi:MAG: alpha/beta hydrolase [Pseudomonadota bacterium]